MRVCQSSVNRAREPFIFLHLCLFLAATFGILLFLLLTRKIYMDVDSRRAATHRAIIIERFADVEYFPISLNVTEALATLCVRMLA